VAQVVSPELELEAICRLPARRSHYTSVVDQQIDAIVVSPELLGKGADRVEAPKVKNRDLNL
jgi:hypothetical protein